MNPANGQVVSEHSSSPSVGVSGAEEQLRVIRDLIPMNYLEGRDTVSALREYSAARWRIIERCKKAEDDCRDLLAALKVVTDFATATIEKLNLRDTNGIIAAARAAIAKATVS